VNESWIVEVQSERVLPIDPSTDGIGSLAVGQILNKLEHGDQCQAPRTLGWLTSHWEQVSKLAVLDERFQLVAHAQIGIATRERRVRDTCRLLGHRSDGLRLQWHGNQLLRDVGAALLSAKALPEAPQCPAS